MKVELVVCFIPNNDNNSITPVKIKKRINRPECGRPKKNSLVAGDRYNNTVVVLAQHEQALRRHILNKDGLHPSL